MMDCLNQMNEKIEPNQLSELIEGALATTSQIHDW